MAFAKGNCFRVAFVKVNSCFIKASIKANNFINTIMGIMVFNCQRNFIEVAYTMAINIAKITFIMVNNFIKVAFIKASNSIKMASIVYFKADNQHIYYFL